MCVRVCHCVQVNGEDLRNASHERAINVLRQTPAVVRMIVYRDDSILKEDDIYDTFVIELVKKPNKGLGLSIVGRKSLPGVFVSDIVSYQRTCYLELPLLDQNMRQL